MIEYSALTRLKPTTEPVTPSVTPDGLPVSAAQAEAATRSHQGIAANRRRLRWRARRGLLENDIVLTRFLDRHESQLSDADVAGLHRLLNETDNDLLDLLLSRKEPAGELAGDDVQRVLRLIRTV